jgi:organic hydroperoxide reductase OsmC/OhrA
MPTHRTVYRWSGRLDQEDYPRHATIETAEVAQPLEVGATTRWGGSGTRWNPETLLGAAVSDCYLLTFLALARKTRLDVRHVEATTELPVEVFEGHRRRVTTISLHATVRVGPGTDQDKLRTMFQKAHKYCVVANSLDSPVEGTVSIEVEEA